MQPDAVPSAVATTSSEAVWGPCLAQFPGFAAVLGPGGSIWYANRMLGGLDAAEARGVPVGNFVPPEHRATLEAAVQDAFHPRLAHVVEVPFFEAGGQARRWNRCTVTPGRLPDGSAVVLLLAVDHDAEHAAAERLARSEQLMTDTQGITHLGTWWWDITKPNADWSPELFRIYGLDPAKHVPTYQDYLTRVHPDDVERVKAATEAVFRDHKPYSHDERIRRPDGSWRHLHTWAHAVTDRSGQLTALMGICQDITDRKEAELGRAASETRFRALFDHSEAGLAIVALDGRILEANAALQGLVGDPAPLRGRLLADLAHTDERRAVAAALDAVRQGAPGRRIDARLVRTGGAPPARVRLDVVRLADGHGDAFALAMAAAPTESAASDAAFGRLQELRQLEEASARRTRLLHMASHELKNPLTPVVFQLHMLERGMLGGLTEAQAHAVHVASKQVGRISALLRDILDVTRIEEGRLAIHPVPTHASELARTTVEAYRGIAAEWGIRLDLDAEADGDWVDADPDRMQQVLANLVSNALKFTPKGGAVRVECRREGNDVVLRVRDTGPGIPAEQRPALFKAFAQLAPGSGREEGTGLGLFVSKSIVDASGGRLELESAPGAGAVFAVHLPARTAAPAHAAA